MQPAEPEHEHSRAMPKEQVEEKELLEILERFYKLFPSEKDCMEELYRRAAQEGFAKCRYCGKGDLERKCGERTIWCKSCRKRTWITGGTFFHGIRAARPWLTAIWLMENGVVLSSSKFHKVAGIAQSSALYIFKKITVVIEKHMAGVEVPTRLFVKVFCKRSRETPAREHPKEEQKEAEVSRKKQKIEKLRVGRLIDGMSAVVSKACEVRGKEAEDKEGGDKKAGDKEAGNIDTEAKGLLSAMETELGVGMGEEEKAIYRELSLEPLNTDVLSKRTGMEIKGLLVALTMLELSGAVARVSGDKYIKNLQEADRKRFVEIEPTEETKAVGKEIWAREATEGYFEVPYRPVGRKRKKAVIEACVRFVRHSFHGISRKYVQNYLSGYRCRTEGKGWAAGELLKWCMQYGRLGYPEILAYVSPLLVKL